MTSQQRLNLTKNYDFSLDQFQVSAFDAIDLGESVLVAAPTGSGKTVVAEYAIGVARLKSMRAFYTAPIKALSNQKYTELVQLYGSNEVGLLTGDNSINPNAPIVVMTTEVLRNMIYARSSSIENLGVVVLDEVHFLQDAYRGPVWEEVIIHLEPTVQLVCLSATVSNPMSSANGSPRSGVRRAQSLKPNGRSNWSTITCWGTKQPIRFGYWKPW